MTNQTPLLRLEGITKRYPAILANDSIELCVQPGEIHAVLGENGAGKSTLMQIIYGVTRPTAGKIFWQGVQTVIDQPFTARKLGIGMVFQHFSLFETLSVYENIALGLDTATQPKKDLIEQIRHFSARYSLEVDPFRKVHSLSIGEQQRVEILRCLLQKPKLLIMDEPTSVLTPQAVRKLFKTLRDLSAEGCSILYISHKLDEIQELCHFATIIRGGRVTGHCLPEEETAQSMAKMMIGREIPHFKPRKAHPSSKPMLTVQNLNVPASTPFGVSLLDINLEVNSHEIVGIAGISGSGQSELLLSLSGEQPLADPKKILMSGKPIGHFSPLQKRKLGFYFIPEERLDRGAVPDMNLIENTMLTCLPADIVEKGLVNYGKAKQKTDRTIELFDVRCLDAFSQAQSLSGGNLQKFILGRDIMQNPTVLVAGQPTWGVDVGAANFIHKSLLDLRDQGTAVLIVSEELEELFAICDRIVVIANGRLSPIKRTSETNIEEIGLWMSGLWDGNTAPKPHAEVDVD